jgi:glycine dehydrogenase
MRSCRPHQVRPPAGAARQPITEVEALAKIRAVAAKNQVFRSFIGQGYYGTHTPNVILRNILENPAWYTAYTPYQAEISQGRMEALINFQTMVRRPHRHGNRQRLAAGRSHRRRRGDDPGQAFGEVEVEHLPGRRRYPSADPGSAADARRAAGPDRRTGQRSGDQYAAALEKGDYFGVLVQYPASSGWLADWGKDADAIHAHNALFVVATDLLALTLLKPPGEMGADIVIGNTQRFGVPFGFGGPHAAFMACRDAYKRSMPGRLIGVSVDAEGKPAYRLTLQTREQHIRREKATSNICTAQVLLAVMASMYAVYHGPQG